MGSSRIPHTEFLTPKQQFVIKPAEALCHLRETEVIPHPCLSGCSHTQPSLRVVQQKTDAGSQGLEIARRDEPASLPVLYKLGDSPTAEATTGKPAAMASRTETGKPSSREGSTKTSQRGSTELRLSTHPRNSTLRARPSSSNLCSNSLPCGPDPAISTRRLGNSR